MAGDLSDEDRGLERFDLDQLRDIVHDPSGTLSLVALDRSRVIRRLAEVQASGDHSPPDFVRG